MYVEELSPLLKAFKASIGIAIFHRVSEYHAVPRMCRPNEPRNLGVTGQNFAGILYDVAGSSSLLMHASDGDIPIRSSNASEKNKGGVNCCLFFAPIIIFLL